MDKKKKSKLKIDGHKKLTWGKVHKITASISKNEEKRSEILVDIKRDDKTVNKDNRRARSLSLTIPIPTNLNQIDPIKTDKGVY